MISAHWEARVPTITAGSKPSLIYDYYGFPPESYDIHYPCVGEPSWAHEIYRMLGNRGIDGKLDEARGFDHGVFVPLKIMYPEAGIPCVQLSLVDSLDPLVHIKVGNALQNVGSQNVLVIGSGFSFHNLKVFFAADNAEYIQLNESFDLMLLRKVRAPRRSGTAMAGEPLVNPGRLHGLHRARASWAHGRQPALFLPFPHVESLQGVSP